MARRWAAQKTKIPPSERRDWVLNISDVCAFVASDFFRGIQASRRVLICRRWPRRRTRDREGARRHSTASFVRGFHEACTQSPRPHLAPGSHLRTRGASQDAPRDKRCRGLTAKGSLRFLL